MPNSYKEIDRHFNFEQVYLDQVSSGKDGDVFLEIGCYLGRSTVYFAECIKESGKDITLHVIDTFNGEGNSKIEESFFKQFLASIKEYKVDHLIKVHHGKSDEMVSKFEDEKFDFIYIDGLHTYSGVKSDIENYLPKLKLNKILGGHDYQYAPIRAAVDEMFPSGLEFYRNTWMHLKQSK